MFLRLLKASININRAYSTKLIPHRAIVNSHQIFVYNSSEQRRYYKNFGHKPLKEPWITRLWYGVLITAFIGSVLDYKW